MGILQQMEHTSLDEIREAVEAGLARGAAAGGYTVEVVYKNAQGDPTAIRTIAEQFAAQGVDVIVPIATGAAQGAAAAAQDVPIVFSAVADPVAAGLLDAFDRTTGNITGVSNGIDVAKIFALADELTPGIGTYGFIYNEGEVNSQSIIEKAKAFLDARGLAYEEVTVASSGEVQQAARGVIAKGVDALFIPNDNTVASALPVLAQEAIAAGLPVYPTADSMVRAEYAAIEKTGRAAARGGTERPLNAAPRRLVPENTYKRGNDHELACFAGRRGAGLYLCPCRAGPVYLVPYAGHRGPHH